jgi:hypothetical protein
VGKVRASDLPEMIANVWTRDDSPTTGLSEADWVEIFRAAGFFSYPPLAVRQPDGSQVPLGRPDAPVTLYRGSSSERRRRMSWASEPSLAEELGAQPGPPSPAMTGTSGTPAIRSPASVGQS